MNKQRGIHPSPVKILHSRPALIHEFNDGDLYQIAVHYAHHSTEGMTAKYGTALKPSPSDASFVSGYEEVVAQSQDEVHRFNLMRAAYCPTFRLAGRQKKPSH